MPDEREDGWRWRVGRGDGGVVVSFRLDVPTLEALDERAEKEGVPRSHVIRDAIEAYFLPGADDEKNVSK